MFVLCSIRLAHCRLITALGQVWFLSIMHDIASDVPEVLLLISYGYIMPGHECDFHFAFVCSDIFVSIKRCNQIKKTLVPSFVTSIRLEPRHEKVLFDIHNEHILHSLKARIDRLISDNRRITVQIISEDKRFLDGFPGRLKAFHYSRFKATIFDRRIYLSWRNSDLRRGLDPQLRSWDQKTQYGA